MVKGYLALILHAHLPYVRHPDREDCLEERWFFEALTESYIPIIKVFDGLLADNIDFKITFSISPPLMSMMNDHLMKERYSKYLEKALELAEKELIRTRDSEFYDVALMYRDYLKEVSFIYNDVYCQDLLSAFRKFMDLGKVEVITSCATHGYLPLMLTEEARRAQVKVAVDYYKQNFGRGPRGIWLPECGYTPGIDQILKEFEIEYFFTDTHGILNATPRPKYGIFAPVYCKSGVAAFGRDVETSKQVWDKEIGYPGDYDYREFYRDLGYELDLDYIGPYIHPSGIRVDTGFKYYRITGKTENKEVYNPARAREKAMEHAGNFIFNREKQIEYLAGLMERKPIVVSPYDGELFGHWWFEGPVWLDYLFRKAYHEQETFKFITPWEYLQEYPVNQVAQPSMSSWGDKGYSEVWLNDNNDWIYPHLHMAEKRMVEMANVILEPENLMKRALDQAARELLLAQSSDWAFIMANRTAVEYAVRRFVTHINRFNILYNDIINSNLTEEKIAQMEQWDNIFTEIDYRIFKSWKRLTQCHGIKIPPEANKKILMLSWEFPPLIVGGLAGHVYNLSKNLARQGYDVHVISAGDTDYVSYEEIEGVKVHRVKIYKNREQEFFTWVMQLNLAMVEAAARLIKKTGNFQLIHAHDWLVALASKTLKKNYRVPLVATIHATEYGRNGGIHNRLQQRINDLEWMLTYEAAKVIACSKYMAGEIGELFQVPADKIHIIPNGVDLMQMEVGVDDDFRLQFAGPHEKIVLFIGRLVREKGVQVLLEAAPLVLARYPETKFVIAGKGPYEDFLREEARKSCIHEKVYFTGFINDRQRNLFLKASDVAVFPSLYEPFGIVALEAMAAGTPVIVSQTGGLDEIIEHGSDGLKVIPGDARALAENIIFLFENKDLAAMLIRNAVEKVKKIYNWETIAKETSGVYTLVSSEGELNAEGTDFGKRLFVNQF